MFEQKHSERKVMFCCRANVHGQLDMAGPSTWAETNVCPRLEVLIDITVVTAGYSLQGQTLRSDTSFSFLILCLSV